MVASRLRADALAAGATVVVPRRVSTGVLASVAGIAALGAAVLRGPEMRRVAVVGASKNAGKTTTLLALAAAVRAHGAVGFLSIGRDGEARDAFLDFAKPQVLVEKDDWLVTAANLAAHCGRALRIEAALPFVTALGATVLAEARGPVAVELAGVAHRAQWAQAANALKSYVHTVLIDGAYHRQAAAHPAVADGVVLAIGAIAGNGAEDALAAALPTLRALAAPPTVGGPPWRMMTGALTDARAAAAPADTWWLATDPSRILLTAAGWRALDRGGGRVGVAHAVPLLAVTCSPFHADGGATDPAAWLAAVAAWSVAAGMPPVPIIDVVAGLVAG